MKTGIYWQDPKYAVGRCGNDPSCVLYLPLHRLDGVSFMSKDAYGHLCTVTGALWTPQGRNFDGIDDYIDCGNNTSVNLIGTGTLESWVKVKAYPVGMGFILAKDAAVGGRGYGLRVNSDGTVSVDRNGLPQATSTTVLSLNQWYHIFAVCTGIYALSWYLYINGVLENDPAGYALESSTTNLNIGRRMYTGAPNYLSTIIGEVRIYNRALSGAEGAHNRNATKWRYQ